jgi:Spy/CpxP family protein refolding chaperone
MIMNAWMKTSMLALAVTALTATAQPDGGPGGPGKGMEKMRHGPDLGRMLDNEEVVQKLGLTADQVTALKARFAEAEKTLIKLRADAQLAEADVRRLMQDDTVDRAAIMKAVEAAGAAQLAVRKAMIEERLAFREIAGPDAAKKVRHHMAKRMQGGGGPEGERPMRKEKKEKRGPGAGGPPVEE